MNDRTLSEREIRRQDFVDNEIFKTIQSLSPKGKEIEWNIEAIGEIRDAIQEWVVDRWQLTNEMEFYPYV
jgi:hypothetical protein